jgi:tetratricopeptide (TPR) repeat protein
MKQYVAFIIILVILRALSLDSVESVDSYNTAIDLHHRGENEPALMAINETIKDNRSNEVAWNLKGDILRDLNRSNDAAKCYRTAHAIAPLYNEPQYSLAAIMRSQKNCNNYREAVNIYNEIQNNNFLDGIADRLKADTLINIVSECGVIEEPPGSRIEYPELIEEAIVLYSDALNKSPRYLAAWNNKGIALADLGRFDESLECFTQALRINSSFAAAWNNRGVTLGKSKRYDESLKALNKTLEIDPYIAEAWYNKATVTLERDFSRYKEAKEYYNISLQMTPELKNKEINDYIYIPVQ